MTTIVDRSTQVARRSAFTRSLDNRAVLITVLLAPVLTFFIVFNTIPTLWLLGLSFYNYSLTSGSPPQFVGIRNFVQLFGNRNNVWADLSRPRPSSAWRSASCAGAPRRCRGGARR